MRNVKIEMWCDACFADGEQYEQATATVAAGFKASDAGDPVTLEGVTARTLDFCDVHFKMFVVPFQVLVEEYGVLVTKKPTSGSVTTTARRKLPPSSEEHICPRCKVGLMGRASVLGHLINVHGVSRVDASQLVPPSGPSATCPDCGYVADAGAGIVVHKRSCPGPAVTVKVARRTKAQLTAPGDD